MLIIRADSGFVGYKFAIRVYRLSHLTGCLALVESHMMSPEQKLAIDVTYLNTIVVSHRDPSIVSTKTHHC